MLIPSLNDIMEIQYEFDEVTLEVASRGGGCSIVVTCGGHVRLF